MIITSGLLFKQDQ